MKSALKCLFASHPRHHRHDDIQIKQEEFYSKKKNQFDEKNKVHSSY